MAIEWNGPTILFCILGPLTLLVSATLLSNNEPDQLVPIKDDAFLVRAIGHELAILGSLAICSIVNGHSAALARWWAVGTIPSIVNKWISGDQGGAVTNLVISILMGYLGWASKAAASTKRA